jgi:hypothetical protein
MELVVYDPYSMPLLLFTQETSCGAFGALCVKTTSRIIATAEAAIDTNALYLFVRNYTPKPMPTLEVCDGARAWL